MKTCYNDFQNIDVMDTLNYLNTPIQVPKYYRDAIIPVCEGIIGQSLSRPVKAAVVKEKKYRRKKKPAPKYDDCREANRPAVRQEVRQDIRQEVRQEIRPEVWREVSQQARPSLVLEPLDDRSGLTSDVSSPQRHSVDRSGSAVVHYSVDDPSPERPVHRNSAALPTTDTATSAYRYPSNRTKSIGCAMSTKSYGTEPVSTAYYGSISSVESECKLTSEEVKREFVSRGREDDDYYSRDTTDTPPYRVQVEPADTVQTGQAAKKEDTVGDIASVPISQDKKSTTSSKYINIINIYIYIYIYK